MSALKEHCPTSNTPQDLSEEEWRRHVLCSIDGLKTEHAGIKKELAENTTVTTEVKDILTAARGAFKFFEVLGKVLKWLGIVAAAITAILGLSHMISHGGVNIK